MQGKQKASTLHQVVNVTAEMLNVPTVRTNEIEIEHREWIKEQGISKVLGDFSKNVKLFQRQSFFWQKRNTGENVHL